MEYASDCLFWFVALWAAGFALVFIKMFIIEYLWCVHGWRPKVYQQHVIDATIRECTAACLQSDRELAENNAREWSKEEIARYQERVSATHRMVVETYIKNFTMYC